MTSRNDELIVTKPMQIFALKKSIGKPGGLNGKTMTINQSNSNTANCLTTSEIVVTCCSWPLGQIEGNQQVLCE